MFNMVRDYTKILLLDLELTCWDSTPPEGESPEVIQIGTCLYDLQAREQTNRTSFIVRPTSSNVSEYCTKLTGLTQAIVMKQGVPIHQVAKRMIRMGSRKYAWGSFGVGDRTHLQDVLPGDLYPLNECHIDFSALAMFALAADERLGQKTILGRFGLPEEGRPHDGFWDAWNLASIVPFVLRLPELESL